MHCLKKKQCDGAQELQVGYSLFLLPGSIKQTKKKQWERAEQNYLSQFSLLPNSNCLPGGNSNLAEKKKKATTNQGRVLPLEWWNGSFKLLWRCNSKKSMSLMLI